jgi:hypothetical protein
MILLPGSSGFSGKMILKSFAETPDVITTIGRKKETTSTVISPRNPHHSIL